MDLGAVDHPLAPDIDPPPYSPILTQLEFILASTAPQLLLTTSGNQISQTNTGESTIGRNDNASQTSEGGPTATTSSLRTTTAASSGGSTDQRIGLGCGLGISGAACVSSPGFGRGSRNGRAGLNKDPSILNVFLGG